jgi:hypothetical protein
MPECLGCPKIVYFDNNLHKILLERHAAKLGKDVKDLTGEDLNTPETEGLGSGRPFDVGTEIVHKCPGYDPKKAKWTGRENTEKKEFHGYKYNAYKTPLPTPQTKQPQTKIIVDNNKPKSSSKDKEVIVFSEQSILETQKQILREIQSLREQIFGNKT